jgi:hypothetical protein
MAGTVSLSSDIRWSAASWLFDWVLKSLAVSVRDQQLAASLTEIVDENLGWLSLEDLSEEARTEIKDLAQNSLVSKGEQEFPRTMPNRAQVIDHLRELTEMISAMPK